MKTLIILQHLICICQCPSTKPSPGFTDNPLYTALWRYSDKNSTSINNSYLEFVQMLFAWINFIGQPQSHGWQQYDSLVALGLLINNQPKNIQFGNWVWNIVALGLLINNQPQNIQFGNWVWFGNNRFHILNKWLVHQTCSLISFVNDNHVNEILMYIWVNCKQSTQKCHALLLIIAVKFHENLTKTKRNS